MTELHAELGDIADRVRAGERPADTVRTLLRRFGFEKRGYHKVRHVRKSLEAAGISTEPDFNTVSLDSLVSYGPLMVASVTPVALPGVEVPSGASEATLDDAVASAEDPAYRLRRLEDSTQVLVGVTPDDDLRRATTLMMAYDFSQLPVMTGPRHIKGVISWRSIGLRYALGGNPTVVRDAMETDLVIVEADASLFGAIPRIVSNDYALVKRSDGTFWIVTTSDLSVRFKELAEPFLLLSEIENQLRGLLDEHVLPALIQGAKDPEDPARTVESAADLTLGEVIRLLERKEVWAQLAPRLDRVEVVARLDQIRSIRNDVMHFDPEGVGPSDLESLRAFTRFLQEFRRWEPPRGESAAASRDATKRTNADSGRKVAEGNRLRTASTSDATPVPVERVDELPSGEPSTATRAESAEATASDGRSDSSLNKPLG